VNVFSQCGEGLGVLLSREEALNPPKHHLLIHFTFGVST
jgi:hypothetical protein